MPTFAYKAKEGPEKSVEGELDAASRSEAVARLERKGLSPVWVRESDRSTAGRRSRWSGRRVTPRDVTVFTIQLAGLTRSAVPILRSLSTIAQQSENPAMARMVSDIEMRIRDGRMLSEALAAYPRQFPSVYVNLVRAGESAGALDVVLNRLAEARERDEDTRRRVQAAVAYPVLIVVVGLATVFVLFAFFLPRVAALFRDAGRLPLPTRILIGLSDFFGANWHWILLGVGLSAAVLARLGSQEKGRMLFDRWKLKLPLVGRFLIETDTARFARTLALLMDSGVGIEQALDLSADAMRNSVLADDVRRARIGAVRQGMPLSEGLRQSQWFPLFVANLTAVGEEGGRLPETLNEIGAFYEKQSEQRTRLLTSLLEPMLILIVGGLVGFIVAAMLMPIFELGGTMR